MLRCPNPFKYGALKQSSQTVLYGIYSKTLGKAHKQAFFYCKKHLCVTLNRRFAYHFKKLKIAFALEKSTA